MTPDEKYERLLDTLRGMGRVAVAYSAGVDSTFLLAAAHAALGEDAIALTAVTAAIPQREVEEAASFCKALGVKHRLVEVDALAVPAFRENAPDRCYHCKKHIFSTLREAARSEGCAHLAEGSNLDDDLDYRPGHRAILELGVESPLRAAALTKAEIRALSKRLGLATAAKPSFACLASRVPYGEEITAEKLRRIDLAEQILLQRGFSQFRVRSHGDLARIEVLPNEQEKLFALRKEIHDALRALGFSYVSADLYGFRSGSLNETL
jgi:uncharacterized protein